MNTIYIYDGVFEKGEKGYPLIKAGAEAYCREREISADFAEAEIQRTEKGKPYFTGVPVEFSLSHSGLLWMCMFSDKPCGLDLQEVKDCRFEDIAKRHFSEAEQHYTELWGIDGFFELWVRKEAFGKMTGEGLFSDMPEMVSGKCDLLSEVVWNGVTYYFTEIFIAPELKCAVCTGNQVNSEEIEMRVLG